MDIATHEKYRIVREYNKSLENENHLPVRDLHIAFGIVGQSGRHM